MRGYGRIRVQDSGESDDDNSEDDDIDDTLVSLIYLKYQQYFVSITSI